MNRRLVGRLRQVEQLSGQMISLADAGEVAVGNVECGILFGTLRDCGYKLRRLARDELQKLGTGQGAAAESYPGSRTDERAPAEPLRGARHEEEPIADPLGKRVLIVDDEPDVVTYLQAWFRDRGFETTAAADGAEAWERALAARPDLITLDMSMPDKSGVKVYRQLKDNDELCHVPVIIITAIGEPMKSFPAGRKQGSSPEGLLSKPINMPRQPAL